jgi:hypothetical protein
MQIPIIFHHSGVFDLRTTLAVKLGKLLSLKGLGNLKGTVSTEVEEDDTVPVLNGTYRLATWQDNEEILNDCLRLLRTAQWPGG